MSFSTKVVVCFLAILHSLPTFADDTSKDDVVALVTTYWSAGEKDELRARGQLVAAANQSVPLLYRWLKSGKVFSAAVPKGQQESYRYARGIRYPYLYIVPENYDPSRAYPVEFKLHGGVGRPEWRPGGDWWLGGDHYNKYRTLDQITVFPASWGRYVWWSEEQSKNLLEILITLKSTYNIDDNRVYLSGVSDGGTGAFYFAFRQPTAWAAFLSYIGHPAVLINEKAIRGDNLDFENLKNSSLYIVNGTEDEKYPAESVQPYIDVLQAARVDYQFRVIDGGKHDLGWYATESPKIEAFKASRKRDPLPDALRWSSDNLEPYGRIHWLRIDKLERNRTPGWIAAKRVGNTYHVYSKGIERFSLLLHPDEVDFSQPVQVIANDNVVYESTVEQRNETLFKWAEFRDRTQLFTAEVTIDL